MSGIRAKNIELGSGVAATKATLAVMRSVALSSSQDPNVRAVAMQVIQGLPSRAYLSEAQALSNFVRDRVRYTRDPQDMELLQEPAFILGLGSDDNPAPMQGDCDDKSTLLAALLMSIGFDGVHFLAVGDSKNVYTHVLIEVCVNGTWYPAETCPDPQVGSVPFGQMARAFPYELCYDVATGKTLNGLGALGAAAYTKLPPRGKSPYPAVPSTAFSSSGPANVSAALWQAFFKNVTGEALARLVEGQASYTTLGAAFTPILLGASLWAGFDTYPLPIPYPDMYVPVGFFDGTMKGGGAAGGGPVSGMPRKQLEGFGASTATQQFPVKNPPHGYSGQGQNVGNGYFVLYGNTNGNPAPDMLSWLAYCVRSNGKYVASPAWADGDAIHSWDASFEPQQRLATQVADLAVAVVGAVAIGYGAAAAGIDGSAEGAAGAGGGAAAGGSATLAPTDVGTAEFTGTYAAPVTAVDTGLTASTIAPISAGDLSSVAAAGVGTDAAAASSTAADVAAGAKAVAAVGGADLALKTAEAQQQTAAQAAVDASTATAEQPSFLQKYGVPLLIGGGLLALMAAG